MVHHTLSRISQSLITAALIILPVCFSASAQDYENRKVQTRIQIIAVSPSKNSATAGIHTAVSIDFNIQLNPATVSDSSIAVFGPLSGKHSGSITFENNNKRLVFQPASQFMYGENISVTLPSSISSTDGGQLDGGYSWKFQTATLLGTDTFIVAPAVITPTNAPYDLAAGDFNRDGYPDLVASNTAKNSISVFFNTTVGGFQAPQIYPAGSSPSKIVVADINNDGAVDIIVVNSGSNSIGIFKNNGNGGFGSMISYTVGAAPKALAAADINNDGFLDIAVTNFSDNNITILKNDGTGNFIISQTITVGSGPNAVVLMDLDNDGLADGVVSNKTSNSISLLKNSGGILTVDTTYVIGGVTDPVDVAVFDYDKDGTPDIAIAYSGSNRIAFLLNAYAGTRLGRFTLYTLNGNMVDVGVSPAALYGNDFDADGDVDLVMASQTASTSLTVIVNNGLGVPPLIDIPVGHQTRGVVGADFSGQFGVIDLIAAGTDNKLRIFRNQVATKPVGTVKLSTQQIAFGSTRIGDTARTTLGIYSLVVPNKIDSVSISHSAFSIVQTLPALLNAYDSSIVKISFAPKSIGNVSDVLRVYCNSSSQILTLPLSGTGSPMNGVTDEKNSPESF